MPIEDDPALAALQAALLDAFAQELSPDEVRARLLADPAAQPYLDWIRGFDPRCIETAQLLVRRWGRRAAPADGSG